MLVKLTSAPPLVNFTNSLHMSAYVPILLRQKEFKPKILVQKKLCTKLSYEKAARKMLVKLTSAPPRPISAFA
jgi:hypothetical protein